MKNKITIGTRGSELALWQSSFVARILKTRFPGLETRILKIKTRGDKILDAPLSRIGDKGLFTKELDHALLNKKIDLAVHSLKDIPTRIPEGLHLSSVTEREDVRDVFIPHPDYPGMKFNDVPLSGTIATGSLRRRCQLLSMRPDLEIGEIRGNLNSRFEKLRKSSWHGMILAHAGVIRLGYQERISEIFPAERFLPAVGQGALGIIIRQTDTELNTMLSSINHGNTCKATFAERALLRRLEGGCQIPIGAFAVINDHTLTLNALVGDLEGKKVFRDTLSGPVDHYEQLGTQLGDQLLQQGAGKILQEIRKLSEP